MDGFTMQSKFGIAVSSELMAILSIVRDLKDLRERLGNIVVAYDKKGNLTSVTDAKGQTITFEYDVNDRLTVKHLPEGDVSYTYDPVGNLLSVTSPDGQVSMTYGILNRVDRVQQTVAGQTYTINYGYDVNGNRTSMTSPWGTTNYTYDALNRLTGLTNPDGKLITFTYDALGRRTRLTYPNGTETAYAYDAASQLTQILHRRTQDNTALAFNNYAYDTAGNRTSMQDLTGSHGYGYDDLHRLTSASHPNLPNETFAYDAVGNRTSDAVMTNYQHNAANRLLENSAYTYTYDNNGNQTGQTHKTTSEHTAYAYTSENQLKQVTLPESEGIVTFKYDPLGRRIEKATPEGTFRYVYDNEDIIAVLDGNNTLTSNITHGPGIDEPLIIKKADTQANYFYHADGLGSIIALSDDTGVIAETYEYQAYGKPVIKDHAGAVFDASPVGNPYLYTAREYDHETGLFYYRARYYSPETGRFLQEDPIGFAGGDVNLYAYVGNSPYNRIDPTGLSPVIGPTLRLFLYWRDLYNYAFLTRIWGQDQFRNDDAMRHCVVSCMTAKKFGVVGGFVAGTGNEIQGLVRWDIPTILAAITGLGAEGYQSAGWGRLAGTQDFAFQLKDFQNNQRGFKCATKDRCVSGGSSNESACISCCKGN
ncbi:MAG: formate--tetrahydrofolate ligase, partial [Elusimicrobiales bacterium]|nr:formate--tetrahydrofolate ligase [Elusimicrobiales bacterium]